MIATGLSSRHRSEFGTSKHCLFAGLQPAAQAILGVSKVLAKRHLEGLFARGTFGAACELLSSSSRATSEQLTSYFRAAHELLPSSLRATSQQLTSYFQAVHQLLRNNSRATSQQLTSYFQAAQELTSEHLPASIPGRLRYLASFYPGQASMSGKLLSGQLRSTTVQQLPKPLPPRNSARVSARRSSTVSERDGSFVASTLEFRARKNLQAL